MRAAGLIRRSMQTVLTSPKYEHLLWLPDLVSLAYRRTFTHHDDGLFSLIRHNVRIIRPRGNESGPGKRAAPGGRR